MDIAYSVAQLFYNLPKQDMKNFGHQLYTTNIRSYLINAQDYKETTRAKIALGSIATRDHKIVGYQQVTIYNQANPTDYEHRQIGLIAPLSYIHCKKLLVAKEYWGKGVSDELFDWRLKLAKEMNLPLVVDIKQENIHVNRLLDRKGFSTQKEWKTKDETPMYRRILENV